MNSDTLQRRFVDCVRRGAAFPEIDLGNFKLYHAHLTAKLSTLLSTCFVLTQEALGADRWKRLINQFLSTQSVSGDFVLTLSHAFYDYLISSQLHRAFPYLKNLLQFEYMLIELYYMEDLSHPQICLTGNRLESLLLVNPEHRLVQFEYPVFREKGASLLEQKGSYYLFLYRHPTTFTVELIELSALYFSALSQLAKRPTSLLAAYLQAAQELGIEEEDLDTDEMIHFFDALHQQGAILGFRE